MKRLELREITKRFGGAVALDRISLSVHQGEFLTLLGASGCGKSTTLRVVAGLVEPDAGEVLMDGRSIRELPVHRRETAMVFQSYALFPHMTVAGNVAFGLKMRRLPAPEMADRVREALELVELGPLAERFPRQLSGGQQQRVALARALVTRPKVLLLDEPLSNLDAQLRDRLRVELRALQRKLGVTTIYVTHDQAEALALSDRIVFMAGGRIVEVGTPQVVYRTPQSRSTAEFLGIANMVEGRVTGANGAHCTIETMVGRVEVKTESAVEPGDEVTLCLRPEDIQLGHYAQRPGALSGRIRHVAYMGAMTDYLVDIEDGAATFRIHVPGLTTWNLGDQVAVTLPAAAAVIRR